MSQGSEQPLIVNHVTGDGRPVLARAQFLHSFTQRQLDATERTIATLNRSARLYRELEREFTGTFRSELSIVLDTLWQVELTDPRSPAARRILIEQIMLLGAAEQISQPDAARLTTALVTLALLRFDDERYEECLSLLDEAVKLCTLHGREQLAKIASAGWQVTELPNTLFRLALKLANVGRRDAMETVFGLGAELQDPQCTNAYGQLLFDRGDVAKARVALTVAAKAGEARSMCTLGKIAFDEGNLAEAKSHWLHSAELDNAEAAYNLGVVGVFAGEAEEAESWWLRAAELGNTAGVDGVHAHVCGLLGRLFLGRGDRARGERWLTVAAEAGDLEAAYYLGSYMLFQGGNEPEGLRLLVAAAEQDPDADVNLGVYHFGRGELDRAEHHWSRAAAAGSPAGQTNLGALLIERGDLVGAEGLLRAAWADGQERAAVSLIRALLGQNRADEAKVIFRTLLGSDDEIVRRLAESAMRDGDQEPRSAT